MGVCHVPLIRLVQTLPDGNDERTGQAGQLCLKGEHLKGDLTGHLAYGICSSIAYAYQA